jgi:hypothetical protein
MEETENRCFMNEKYREATATLFFVKGILSVSIKDSTTELFVVRQSRY